MIDRQLNYIDNQKYYLDEDIDIYNLKFNHNHEISYDINIGEDKDDGQDSNDYEDEDII